MKYIKEKINGVYTLVPDIYKDNRGYFFESFNMQDFWENVGVFTPVQENESSSKSNVLRGLHFQLPPFNQAKLVRVLKGTVLDVIVDIRQDSDTFGEHMRFVLCGHDNIQLYIPRGFAHGFVVLDKNVKFQYKVDNPYAPEFDRGISYDDSDLYIDWEIQNPIVSEKDRNLPRLRGVQQYTQEQWEENYNSRKVYHR